VTGQDLKSVAYAPRLVMESFMFHVPIMHGYQQPNLGA
jgi:hypothetical protein